MNFRPDKFIKIALIGTGVVVLLFVLIGVIKPDYAFEHRIHVDNSVEKSFFVFNDTLRIPDWTAHIEEVSLIEGDGRQPGSKYYYRVAGYENVYEVTKEITSFEPNKRVAYRLTTPSMIVESEVRFTPNGRGTDILAHHTITGNTAYWRSMLMFLHKQIRKKVKADYDRLKELIENE